MKGYDEWKCTDSDGERMEDQELSFAFRKRRIILDRDKIEEIDLEVSNKFDGEVVEMFSLLADLSDGGLIGDLAGGLSVDDCIIHERDAFARLAKLSDRMAALRAKAVSDAAEDEA